MTGGPALRVPWRDRDVVAVTGAALAGLVAILLGWFGASGSPAPARQMLWLNVAVAGLAILAIGNCLWLMRLRRAVGERRAALVSFEAAEEVEEVEAVGEHSAVPARAMRRTTVESTQWVRGDGMARIHRPHCPLVEGKDVWPAQSRDGELCGVCVDG